MRVKDKVCIVTGGASGLGRHYCAHLCREGALLLIADINHDGAIEVANELNRESEETRAWTVPIDVTAESDTVAMAQSAVDLFGRIDVLINNVGTYPHVAFEDITYEAWRQVMSINLDSVFLCTKAVLPQMKKQKLGKIINVATNLVWIGLPNMVHYIAAKSAIVGFTRALAREVGSDNISVNALAPGAVMPPLDLLGDADLKQLENIISYQALKWMLRPNDLVGAMLFLVSSDSDFISGQILTVDGGLTNH